MISARRSGDVGELLGLMVNVTGDELFVMVPRYRTRREVSTPGAASSAGFQVAGTSCGRQVQQQHGSPAALRLASSSLL